MYGQFSYEFRDPLATTMATAHFAQGGFRDWTELYWQYPHLWRVLVTVAFIVFSLILRNLPIAVLVSHRKEMCLRENYSYHPFWTGQPNVPDKNGLVTFNPARGGWRWDKKDPYVPKEDLKMHGTFLERFYVFDSQTNKMLWNLCCQGFVSEGIFRQIQGNQWIGGLVFPVKNKI